MNKPNYFLGGIDRYQTILNFTQKVNDWNDATMIVKTDKNGFKVRKLNHQKAIKHNTYSTYEDLIMDFCRKFEANKLETHYNLQTTKTYMSSSDKMHHLSDPKTAYNHLLRLQQAGLLVATTKKGDFYVKTAKGKLEKRTICCKNINFPVDIIAFRKPVATQTNFFSQEKTETELLANIGRRNTEKVEVASKKAQEDYSAKIAELRKTKGNAIANAYFMQLMNEGKI